MVIEFLLTPAVSKVSRTNGLTWAGARDTCVSYNLKCNDSDGVFLKPTVHKSSWDQRSEECRRRWSFVALGLLFGDRVTILLLKLVNSLESFSVRCQVITSYVIDDWFSLFWCTRCVLKGKQGTRWVRGKNWFQEKKTGQQLKAAISISWAYPLLPGRPCFQSKVPILKSQVSL